MNRSHYTPKRNILLVVGSRHGSTLGIAEVIGDSLRHEGFRIDVQRPDQLVHIEDYDAVIIGSAVYDETWLPEMKEFVADYRRELSRLPVYMFSAGPVGVRISADVRGGIDVEDIAHVSHAREHKVFHGSIDRRSLSPLERFRARLSHTPEGDERDWGNIIAWARHLGNEFRKIPIRAAHTVY